MAKGLILGKWEMLNFPNPVDPNRFLRCHLGSLDRRERRNHRQTIWPNPGLDNAENRRANDPAIATSYRLGRGGFWRS